MRYTENNLKDFERHQSEKKMFSFDEGEGEGKVYPRTNLLRRVSPVNRARMLCYRHIKWKRREAIQIFSLDLIAPLMLHHNQNIIESKPFVSKFILCGLIFPFTVQSEQRQLLSVKYRKCAVLGLKNKIQQTVIK